MSRLQEQHLSLAMRSEVCFVSGQSSMLHSMYQVSSLTIVIPMQEMRIRKNASKEFESFEGDLQEELAGMMESLQDEKNEKMRAAAAFKRQGSCFRYLFIMNVTISVMSVVRT